MLSEGTEGAAASLYAWSPQQIATRNHGCRALALASVSVH